MRKRNTSKIKQAAVLLGATTALAVNAAALPNPAYAAGDGTVQLAAACGAKKGCNPCAAKGCNPCAAKKGCNPCAAKKGCNPCAAKGCNPCAAKKACNPCAAKK
ncbi:MAG: hypothetical protein QF893_06005 [Alphaproteobacteria bacterium]|nr:hypothetical protein [Alphaproteobacteria bacterium]